MLAGRLASLVVVMAVAVAVAAAARATSRTAAAEVVLESLEPQEHVLEDGSRAGSLVYVDAHGDLVQVRYLAGPAAGSGGFRLEERPVQVTAKDAAKDAAQDTAKDTAQDAAQDAAADVEEDEDPQAEEAQESAPALQVVPPPREVRRAPTPRPSDVFWQPKENSDVARKEKSEMRRPLRLRRPPPVSRSRFARVRELPPPPPPPPLRPRDTRL